MAKKKTKVKTFSFVPGFSIGAMAAEQDRLLEQCFLTNACYKAINDMDDPRCGVIGRSGTGKTAILQELMKDRDQVSVIEPEALAFQYLGSSDLIKALRESHVPLDLFYKLLWRHVFVVEILRHTFPDETKRYGRIQQVISKIKKTLKPDPERDRAINYLDEWGGSILQAPQERIKEIHENLAKRLRSRIGMFGTWNQLFGVGASVEGEKESSEETTERIKIAKEIVNTIQIQELNVVKNYLGSYILSDRQKPLFILIDDLDRFWVEGALVYELIRALILEIYDWSNMDNLKIIYVLRDNILQKIESEFTTRSYQREKLEDQRIRLRWTKKELIDLVNKRLEVVSINMGISSIPTLKDIVPKRTGNHPSGTDYIIERTLDRPRDIIDFVNRCAELAIGKNTVGWSTLQKAEEIYSQGRLKALLDEWRENCPGLAILTKLVHGGPPKIPLDFWSESDLTDVFTDPSLPKEGWLDNVCQDFMHEYRNNPAAAIIRCRKEVLKVLYEVGLVGIKIGEGATIKYAHEGSPILSNIEIDMNPDVIIHPTFHRALEIKRF